MPFSTERDKRWKSEHPISFADGYDMNRIVIEMLLALNVEFTVEAVKVSSAEMPRQIQTFSRRLS